MSAITIRLPADLQSRLDKLCKRQHRSASEVLRESLRQYIVAQQLRDLRDDLRPYAEAAGFLTDEDVFKVVS